MVAEYDVLRDEGEALARRLAQAGVPLRERCSAGMNHGFLKHVGRLPEAEAELDDACLWLRRLNGAGELSVT
jgi:acetyl esterase